ncbi:MAG TPA: ABC transporter substrate-binding protein [Candidatus Limnocylindrales bacterium]|nr:ABC transporter substrate-binding protein [Candidatus Limnocylindrales bacterium]
MKRRPSIVKLAYAFVVISPLLMGSPLNGAEALALRGVHNSLGGTMTPVFVAQDLGLFTKHGLQHSLQYIAATTAIQALAAGSEEIGLVGNQCIDIALEGADLVYIADTASRFIFRLYGDPAIKSVADLKGKVIVATQPAASTDYASRMLLRKYGLVPDKDVKIIYAGSSPALISMLKAGNAVAGLINPPATYQAQELGLKQIVNVTELNIPFIFVAVCTTRKVIQQKPEAVTRYLRAYTEAISIILRDKETTLKVMAKNMKMDNRQWVEAVYDDVARVLQRVPYMTKPEVQSVLEVVKNPKGDQAKPEDFFDNSFLQKLDFSGYINSLYKR